MPSDRIQDIFATAYIAGAKAELYILLLKLERASKDVDNSFDCERYAVKVLLDFAINSLDDQNKKNHLQAIINHVMIDTEYNDLNETYHQLENFTI